MRHNQAKCAEDGTSAEQSQCFGGPYLRSSASSGRVLEVDDPREISKQKDDSSLVAHHGLNSRDLEGDHPY